MKLLEIIEGLNSFDRKETIYASLPWTMNSDAIVTMEPESGGLPPEAEKLGMKYFLEVFIAKDFLDDWKASLGAKPTIEQECSRVIQYAINDA
jgi:hypothetical protein